MEENLSKMSLFSLAKTNNSKIRDQNVAMKGLMPVEKYEVNGNREDAVQISNLR